MIATKPFKDASEHPSNQRILAGYWSITSEWLDIKVRTKHSKVVWGFGATTRALFFGTFPGVSAAILRGYSHSLATPRYPEVIAPLNDDNSLIQVFHKPRIQVELEIKLSKEEEATAEFPVGFGLSNFTVNAPFWVLVDLTTGKGGIPVKIFKIGNISVIKNIFSDFLDWVTGLLWWRTSLRLERDP